MSEFKLGDRVVAKVTAQGLYAGEVYEVERVDVVADSPTGEVLAYALSPRSGTHGKMVTVFNSHLLLEREPVDFARPKVESSRKVTALGLVRNAHRGLQRALDAMQAHYDDRSDEWQASNSGDEFQCAMDAIEAVVLDCESASDDYERLLNRVRVESEEGGAS